MHIRVATKNLNASSGFLISVSIHLIILLIIGLDSFIPVARNGNVEKKKIF